VSWRTSGGFIPRYGSELIAFGSRLRPECVDRKHAEFVVYMTGVTTNA
jgi:hypothetical protein